MKTQSNIKTMNEATTTNSRLRTFDFLRGLAIISVIIVHTSQYFPSHIKFIDSISSYGRYGVQLFYFVSALTMCHMWTQRKNEINPIKNFYIRRFFRIAPLFWIAIATYLFINGTNPTYWAPEGIGIQQIFLTATFLHGFWPNSINSVVPGGWSIAVEMTFYIIFPHLIIKIKDNKKLFIVLAVIIWAFNIFLLRDFLEEFLLKNYNRNNLELIKDYLYLNFINQAPIFLLGCYIYSAVNKKPNLTEASLLIAWILIGAASKFIHKTDGLNFLIAYILLGTFVYFCIKFDLKWSILESLGRNSYSIYLTHFLILHYLEKITPPANGISYLLLYITITTTTSYLLSIIIYELIEKKVQYHTNLITK